MSTHLNLTLPAPAGQTPESLKGQWVSVMAFGEVHTAQVEEVTPLPWDEGRVTLLARFGEPDVEPTEEPVFVPTETAGTHINCPHSNEPMDIEQAMICSDIGEPGGQA